MTRVIFPQMRIGLYIDSVFFVLLDGNILVLNHFWHSNIWLTDDGDALQALVSSLSNLAIIYAKSVLALPKAILRNITNGQK